MQVSTLIKAVDSMVEAFMLHNKNDVVKLEQELIEVTEAYNKVNNDKFIVELDVYKKDGNISAIFVTLRNATYLIQVKRYREFIIENFEDFIFMVTSELRSLLFNPEKTYEEAKEAIRSYVQFYNEYFTPLELVELKKEDNKATCIIKSSKGFTLIAEKSKE